jgi:PERQ amino acid-rich with GYF domain-containing protein
VTVSGFASTLEALPLDADLIADAVYANSTIMDGRHFATEFVRRKKLADRGVTEKSPSTPSENKAGLATGGWNEVAKKTSGNVPSPGDEPTPLGFKVVASKKKAKK